MTENRLFIGLREARKGGETLHPAVVIRQDGNDLRLLQHELGNQNRVRIARMPPGQIAAFAFKPINEIAAKRGFLQNVRMPQALTTHTQPLTTAQAEQLKRILTERGFAFETKPYTLFTARKEKLSIAVYEKGPKAVLQGKGLEEFITFTLEPEILGEAKLGYEEVHDPEKFEPHFGIDESGKGDFFGPLVIAGAYVDATLAKKFQDAGIRDSKVITSDSAIRKLAKMIRESGAAQSVIVIGPEKYNQLYAKIGNLNRLLAWGHARIIENLCELRPDCPRALSDKFGDSSLIERALMEKGRGIILDQRTKAESDFAVAAASILAREKFIDWMETKGFELNLGASLPRGASAQVKAKAVKIVQIHGEITLRSIAKMHFKTGYEVLGLPVPERPAFVRRSSK